MSTSKTTPDTINAGRSRGGDRLLGECSLNLVEVVSGRAPHVQEWVPLDSEGDLRLSLDYDSVGGEPVPGDSVVLLCLSNRLDFFPLPVWNAVEDPSRPWSPSWLWARSASHWLPGRASSSGGSSGDGFRVEEAGDDFFLVSYATPEGWRCAVEVHRFLVYPDPTAPQRWTLSSVRDHVITTPAAAAFRGAVLRASQEESALDGGKQLAISVVEGISWTAARWWGGGLNRARDDLWFAVGLTTPESPDESHQNQQNRDGEDEGEREEDRVGAGNEERKKQDGDRDDECKEAMAAAPAAVTGRERDSAMAATSVVNAPPELSPPPSQQQQHLCPITRCLMEDPAVAADGYTYERSAIERWLSEHDTSPVTGNALETKVVFKNWSLVSSLSPTSSVTAPGT
ncbi:unnamed protein product [Pylaiella littoralis]